MHSVWSFFQERLRGDKDLKTSEKLLQASGLSGPVSKHLLAFEVKRAENKGRVFVLGTSNLSQKSADDINTVVSTLQPDLVLAYLSDEHVFGGLQSAQQDAIPPPTTTWDVLKQTISGGLHAEAIEQQAGLQLIQSLFGSTHYQHVTAAREAAKLHGCAFYYGTPLASCGAESTESSHYRDVNDLKSRDAGLKWVSRLAIHASAASAGEQRSTSAVDDNEEPTQDEGYAAGLFTLLGNLNTFMAQTGLPWNRGPLQQAEQMIRDVGEGKEVSSVTLAVASNFRLVIEVLRTGLCLAAREPEAQPAPAHTLQRVPEEDQQAALLAAGLKQAASKNNTIVALVDAQYLAPLRKHWNAVLSPREAEVAKGLLQTAESFERWQEEREELLKEKKKTEKEKLLALTMAGTGAVVSGVAYVKGGATFSNTVMALIKYAYWKNAGLGALSLVKRKVGFILGHAAAPKAAIVAKAVAPKTAAAAQVAAGKAAVSAKVTVLKAASSAKKIKFLAHAFMSQVKSTALSAIRVTSYNVMQRSNFRRPGPWLLLGSSAATCCVAYTYGEQLEAGLEIAPSAPRLARLGRGCESLGRATEELKQMRMWPQRYDELYHKYLKLA